MKSVDEVLLLPSIALITVGCFFLPLLSQAQNRAEPDSSLPRILVGSATVIGEGELAARVEKMEGVSCGDTSRRVNHPTAVKDFVGARVKTIRVLHYTRERNFSKPAEVQALVSKVWQGNFLDQAACGILWDEMAFWSIESTLEFKDGKKGLLITDGEHVAVRDHDGKNWFFRLWPGS